MYNARVRTLSVYHITLQSMNEQTTTKSQLLLCLECKNETQLAADLHVGDVIECDFCGIEYEVLNAENNEYTVSLLEEEK